MVAVPHYKYGGPMKTLLVSALFLSSSAFAQVTCETLFADMLKLQSEIAKQDSTRSSEMNIVVTWLFNQHATWSQDEGRAVNIPYGTFGGLRTTAVNFRNSNFQLNRRYDQKIDAKMTEVLAALPGCLK